ncbi:MAG: DUF4160 domain-containing protein [Parachlamydia sp.]|nr:DUF4160 domain-containing protein [Parachlamydia sp.]
MPEISRFLGIVIRMYPFDHNPPHFHAVYGNYDAQFLIEPLEMISGNLPPRIQGLVIEWAALHQKEIKKNWELLQKEQPAKKIKPLV